MPTIIVIDNNNCETGCWEDELRTADSFLKLLEKQALEGTEAVAVITSLACLPFSSSLTLVRSFLFVD